MLRNEDSDIESDSDDWPGLVQLDGPMDSSSESSSSSLQIKAGKRIRAKTNEEKEETSFFRKKENLEEEIRVNPKAHIRNYLGNLRNEQGYKIIKSDTLALVDCDIMGNQKEISKENIVFVKLLKCKTEKAEKRHLPVCLMCNTPEKTKAILSSIDRNTKVSKKFEDENLYPCTHSAVSEVLFDQTQTNEANRSLTLCKVLNDNEKLHLATSFDGQTHGLNHINKARGGNKAQCYVCKSTRCNHTREWDKELKKEILNYTKEEHIEYYNKEEDQNENTSINSNHKLEYPFDEETQKKMRVSDSTLYDSKINLIPKTDGLCPHKNSWDKSDPIEKDWVYSSDVKLAHSTYIEDKTRKVYYRSVLGQTYCSRGCAKITFFVVPAKNNRFK